MGTSYYGTNTATGVGHTSRIVAGPPSGSSVQQTTGSDTENYGAYLEIMSQGGAPSAVGGLPSTGGDINGGGGWYDDTHSLAGTTAPSGTWQCICNVKASDSSNPVGTLYAIFWACDSVFDFTYIGTSAGQNLTITNTPQQVTLTTGTLSGFTFPGGTGLYVALWWHQTGGGQAGTHLSASVPTSSSVGVSGANGGLEFIVPAPTGTVSGTDLMTLGDSLGFGASVAGSDLVTLGDSLTLQALLPVPNIPPQPMPLISLNAPAYSNVTSYVPSRADDASYGAYWRSASTPSSGSPIDLVYDLSHVPSTQRHLVVVNLLNELGNWRPALDGHTQQALMQNYTLDANTAAGGPNSQPAFPYSGYPPTGWVNLVTVTGNDYPTRQHIIDLTGYNWLRFRCTSSLADSGNNNPDVFVQMDVHDAHLGLMDRWLFVGDSITAEGMGHQFVSADWGPAIPGAVCQLVSGLTYQEFYPATIDAGNATWETSTVVGDITDYFAGFSGGFVSIALGTNDINQTFAFSAADSNITGIYANFVTLINRALALNNVVIIPKIPYGDGGNGHMPNNAGLMNAYLASQLPITYPSQFGSKLFIGPDFYTFFAANPQLLRSDGIHPTYIEVGGLADGYEEMHLLWAQWMNQYIYQVSSRPAVFTLSDSAVAVYKLSDSLVEG